MSVCSLLLNEELYILNTFFYVIYLTTQINIFSFFQYGCASAKKDLWYVTDHWLIRIRFKVRINSHNYFSHNIISMLIVKGSFKRNFRPWHGRSVQKKALLEESSSSNDYPSNRQWVFQKSIKLISIKIRLCCKSCIILQWHYITYETH